MDCDDCRAVPKDPWMLRRLALRPRWDDPVILMALHVVYRYTHTGLAKIRTFIIRAIDIFVDSSDLHVFIFSIRFILFLFNSAHG